MLILKSVLTAEHLAEIQAEVAEIGFADGKGTAQGAAARAKSNLELARGERTDALGNRVLAAVRRQPQFEAYALPHKIRLPIISGYEPGMTYGDHVDAPVMGAGPIHATRTDLSMTLFLSPPEDYDGGELVLHTPEAQARVKLPAGHAVVYPTVHIHRVEPVTRGRRLAAVTWIQSRVRDHEDRRLIYDLDRTIGALGDIDERHRLRLRHVHARLMQKWVEA